MNKSNKRKLQRIVTKSFIGDSELEKKDLQYWLSRPPGERFEEVERLRRKEYGPLPKMQKVAIVKTIKKYQ